MITKTPQVLVWRPTLGDRVRAYRVPLALGTMFAVLTASVDLGATAGLDRVVEPHTGLLASGAWGELAIAADPLVTALAVTVACLVLWYRQGGREPVAWCIGLAVALGAELTLKWQLHQIPFDPPERLLNVWVLTGSYPSGHALRAVIIAGIACAAVPRLRWLWIGYAVCMTSWVLASGMHLVSDTLGGVLLGGTVVAATAAYSSNAARRPPRTATVPVG